MRRTASDRRVSEKGEQRAAGKRTNKCQIRGKTWEEKRTKEDPEKEERAGKIRREHAEDVSSFFAEPDWYAWSY